MHVLAVIVRYNTSLKDSETITSISEAVHEDPELLNAITFLVCDNSPEALVNPETTFPLLYRHLNRNMGVSGAYNRAIDLASELGLGWLLLLDQDTRLTASFLRTMAEHSLGLTERSEIAAVVPIVQVGDLVVSPKRSRFNRDANYADGSGLLEGEAFAINSGSMMRVEALKAVGGFSSDFWLDYSDIYVYHQFHTAGFRVWRASDAELQHSMTILDYDKLMSTWRYVNFLEAEGAFNDIYKGYFENAVYTLRVAVRVILQRRRHKSGEFSKITRRYLWNRLRMSRARRLNMWREKQRLR